MGFVEFCKKSEVLTFARSQGLSLYSDDTIMRRMFQRLFTDPEFAERQRSLAGIAKLFYRLGLTRLLEVPGLRLVAPFMAFNLTKT